MIPKAIREDLGLRGGEELDVTAADGRIQIEPTGAGMRIERRRGRAVIQADRDVPALTAADVRATLERVRR